MLTTHEELASRLDHLGYPVAAPGRIRDRQKRTDGSSEFYVLGAEHGRWRISEDFQPVEITFAEVREPGPATWCHTGLGQAAARQVNVPELPQTTVVLRAQAYRRHLFAEFDRIKDGLLL